MLRNHRTKAWAAATRVARQMRKKHEMELKGSRDLVLGTGDGDASEMVGGAGVSQNHARSCSDSDWYRTLDGRYRVR